MLDFLDTVKDMRLRGLLENAVQGQGAFSRFKDAVARDPDERQRWFAFRDARLRRRIIEWLGDKDIEPILE